MVSPGEGVLVVLLHDLWRCGLAMIKYAEAKRGGLLGDRSNALVTRRSICSS